MHKTVIAIENTKITWGDLSWDSYRRFSSCGNEWDTLRGMLGIKQAVATPVPFLSEEVPKNTSIGGKHLYKEFSDMMGCTPSRALTTLNKLMYKVWIVPIGRDVVWAYCRENATNAHKRFLNSNRLKTMHEQMDKIVVCQNDRQRNLIPLCVALKSTPKHIKDKVPKHVWKQLINNSLTRNGLIARDIDSEKNPWNDLLENVQLSSCLIKSGYGTQAIRYNMHGTGLVEGLKTIYLNNIAKENRFLSNKVKLRETWDLLIDTTEMAEELDKPVNYNWKLNRWLEEHNKFSKEITARKFSDVRFTHKLMPKLKSVIADSGYVARLLDNQLAIGLEGKDMGHCVASYAQDAARGKYVVYSITSPEGNRSTLGLRIDNKGGITFNQHYGRHNSRVNSLESRFGKNVVSDLNGEPYLTLEWEKTK